jgi:hypothetical protein
VSFLLQLEKAATYLGAKRGGSRRGQRAADQLARPELAGPRLCVYFFLIFSINSTSTLFLPKSRAFVDKSPASMWQSHFQQHDHISIAITTRHFNKQPTYFKDALLSIYPSGLGIDAE